jgi:hypothetical protein
VRPPMSDCRTLQIEPDGNEQGNVGKSTGQMAQMDADKAGGRLTLGFGRGAGDRKELDGEAIQ